MQNFVLAMNFAYHNDFRENFPSFRIYNILNFVTRNFLHWEAPEISL